ncbi:Uncharacterised protein [Amycolatopsis camponoti]|uniref:Uncharacterized protein n=1 Tax=Amycolatopsis camponoti TaxID=2606593 RepID=A0A6I8LM84_9PSEU|nr:Uncharacterised protein [Amycolatopsis camponoti]
MITDQASRSASIVQADRQVCDLPNSKVYPSRSASGWFADRQGVTYAPTAR